MYVYKYSFNTVMVSSKKKILIVTTSLKNGGAERFVVNLSNLLSCSQYEVHVVTITNSIDYDLNVKVLNLGTFKENHNFVYGKIKSFIVFKDYIKKNKFDFIIDNRTRTRSLIEIIYQFLLYRRIKVIYMVHSAKIENYFPVNRLVRKIIDHRVYKIVSVSEKITKKIKDKYGFKSETIYNPVSIPKFHEESHVLLSLPEKFILFYGRLDNDVKNFDLLIEAYQKSRLKTKNVKLIILGDGKDQDYITSKIDRLGLSNEIVCLPKQSNPFFIVEKAIFTVLTSKYEGFPSVLVESLRLGVPVVSVDCESGPSEIIVDGFNGLLVENNNVGILSSAMNRMVEDDFLYQNCKKNSKNSVSHLSFEVISEYWKEILK